MSSRSLGLSTLTVLHAVAQGCRHGFDIIDATGLQSGTVYRALSRLEASGLLRSKWEAARVALQEKRPRRKYYEITSRAEQELAAARRRLLALTHLPGINGQQEADHKRS
jgi:DNA-binding PadR family transcriptional regulator